MSKEKCPHCPKELMTKSLQKHQVEHSTRFTPTAPYRCDECRLWFDNDQDESRHTQMVHPGRSLLRHQEILATKRPRIGLGPPHLDLGDDIAPTGAEPIADDWEGLPDPPAPTTTPPPPPMRTTPPPAASFQLDGINLTVPLERLRAYTLDDFLDLLGLPHEPDLDDDDLNHLDESSGTEIPESITFTSLGEMLFYLWVQQEGLNR